MKIFTELTPAQQQTAIDHCTRKLLEGIIEGAIRFNDELNKDDLQQRIDVAFAEMERLHTPWFTGEAIMEACRDDIIGMAQCQATDSLYTEQRESVIDGIVE